MFFPKSFLSPFISIASLGTLMALFLTLEKAEASWSWPRCKAQCTSKKCGENIDRKIECEENCKTNSIKACLSSTLKLTDCRHRDYAKLSVGKKMIEKAKLKAVLASPKTNTLPIRLKQDQEQKLKEIEQEIDELNIQINRCQDLESDKSKTPKPTSVGQEQNLEDYISQIQLPPAAIQSLVEIGRRQYKANSPISMARAAAERNPKQLAGGGRTKSWILDTFGESENVIISRLVPLLQSGNLAAPKTWSVEEINNAFNAAIHNPTKSTNKPVFHIIKGLGVNYLQNKPYGKDSIVQLASQFNYLESPGPYIVKVEEYLDDPTQGPLGAMEAAAASLYRLAAVKAGKLDQALIHVLPADHSTYYTDGYLELFKINDTMKFASLEKIIGNNINKLRILFQWVMCEATGAWQLQVFSAAPSFQGHRIPPQGSPEEKICTLLVSLQYEVIGKLAVIQSLKRPGNIVNVNLTLVGQGAFKNPESVMKTAFEKIAKVVKGHDNIHIYIHGFSQSDVNLIRKSHSPQSFDLLEEQAP